MDEAVKKIRARMGSSHQPLSTPASLSPIWKKLSPVLVALLIVGAFIFEAHTSPPEAAMETRPPGAIADQPEVPNDESLPADRDICGAVGCRGITTAQSNAALTEVMHQMQTDCKTVAEVHLLNKSTNIMMIYEIRCDDGTGLQHYQVSHWPTLQELFVLKMSGRWMQPKGTEDAPTSSLLEAVGVIPASTVYSLK